MGGDLIKTYLLIDNKKIYYSDVGKGITIVLLHGYLESSDTLKDFSIELSKKHRVISFDIPGHGDSEVISEFHSMEVLAKVIFKSLQKLKVDNCFMVGHSMGGFLTLMFHKLYPELLSGFCLFHSYPFADSEATKKKRLREIEFVKEDKKDLIATFNLPNAFANDNLELFKSEIENTVKIALQTTKEGIIANLHSMISRPDLSESLKNSKIPFLLIASKKDNYIDFNTVVQKIKTPEISELHILEKSGHMGFIEEKNESANIISHFLLNHLSS